MSGARRANPPSAAQAPDPSSLLGALLQAVGELAERGAEVGHGAPDQGQEGPVYSSRTVNRVAPSVPGARVKGAHALEQAQRHAAAPGHPLAGAELGHLDREGAARVGLGDDLEPVPGRYAALDPLDP